MLSLTGRKRERDFTREIRSMKLSALLSAVLLCAAIAALVITNPTPDQYADYASEKAETYLAEGVCNDLPSGLGDLLSGRCDEIIQAVQPQLETILRDRTERLNLGVASIYRTSFSIPQWPMIPEYSAETLGIVNQFITYRLSQ